MALFVDDLLLWPLYLLMNVAWLYWTYTSTYSYLFRPSGSTADYSLWSYIEYVFLLPALAESSYPLLVSYMAYWKTYVNSNGKGYDWIAFSFWFINTYIDRDIPLSSV